MRLHEYVAQLGLHTPSTGALRNIAQPIAAHKSPVTEATAQDAHDLSRLVDGSGHSQRLLGLIFEAYTQGERFHDWTAGERLKILEMIQKTTLTLPSGFSDQIIGVLLLTLSMDQVQERLGKLDHLLSGSSQWDRAKTHLYGVDLEDLLWVTEQGDVDALKCVASRAPGSLRSIDPKAYFAREASDVEARRALQVLADAGNSALRDWRPLPIKPLSSADIAGYLGWQSLGWQSVEGKLYQDETGRRFLVKLIGGGGLRITQKLSYVFGNPACIDARKEILPKLAKGPEGRPVIEGRPDLNIPHRAGEDHLLGAPPPEEEDIPREALRFVLKPPASNPQNISLTKEAVPMPAIVAHLCVRELMDDASMRDWIDLLPKINPGMDVEALASLEAMLTLRSPETRQRFGEFLPSNPNTLQIEEAQRRALEGPTSSNPKWDEIAAHLDAKADKESATGRFMWSTGSNLYRDPYGRLLSVGSYDGRISISQYVAGRDDERRASIEEVLPSVDLLAKKYPWLRCVEWLYQTTEVDRRREGVTFTSGPQETLYFQIIRPEPDKLWIATVEDGSRHRLIDLEARQIIYDIPFSVWRETLRRG